MAVRLPALCHLDWQERHGAITTTRPLDKKKEKGFTRKTSLRSADASPMFACSALKPCTHAV